MVYLATVHFYPLKVLFFYLFATWKQIDIIALRTSCEADTQFYDCKDLPPFYPLKKILLDIGALKRNLSILFNPYH